MSHVSIPDELVRTGVEEPPGKGRLGTLVACCVAVFVAQLGLVLPAAINGEIQRALGTTGSQLTWVSAAFLVPIAMFSLSFGLLGDLHGRKRLLVGGGIAMAVGFTISATGSGIGRLWTGQAISGVGAAALFASSLAVVTASSPGARRRAVALAAWTTALSTGALAAPLLSGALVEHHSYHWAFGVSGAIAVVSVVTSAVLTVDSRAPQGRSMDWAGQISIAVALFALLFGVIEGPERGWTSPTIVGTLTVAVALLIVFVIVESRSAAPMLRVSLFRIPTFAAAAVVSVLGMFGFLGGAYVLSIRLGVIQHQSTLRAAIPFVIIQGVTPFIWPLLARLLSRVGPRIMIVAGLLAIAGGQLWLVRLPISDTSLLTLVPVLLLNGVGFGLLVSALTAAVVNSVPVTFAGMASAMSSMVRDLGQTLAPAVIGTVALTQAAALATSGLNTAVLAPQQLGAARGVLGGGGPMALNSVPLGPDVARVASDALTGGYNLGLTVTAVCALVAAAVGALWLRGGVAPAQTIGH